MDIFQRLRNEQGGQSRLDDVLDGETRNAIAKHELLEVIRYLMLGAPVLSLLALFVWPRAFVAMVAYWLLARVPVMLIQYLDIQTGWQTHYGKVPAEFAGADADARIWMLTKAQLCIWMAFTVLLGCAFAAIGAATVRRR